MIKANRSRTTWIAGGLLLSALALAEEPARPTVDASDPVALAAWGDTLRDGNPAQFAAAHEFYGRALSLDPSSTYALLADATAYLREAVDLGRRTDVKKKDRDAAVSRLLQRAEFLAQRALAQRPDDFEAVMVLAERHVLGDNPSEALRLLDSIEAAGRLVDGHRATYYAWRGYALSKLGRPADALSAWKKAHDAGEPFDAAEWADERVHPLPEGVRPPSHPPTVRSR